MGRFVVGRNDQVIGRNDQVIGRNDQVTIGRHDQVRNDQVTIGWHAHLERPSSRQTTACPPWTTP